MDSKMGIRTSVQPVVYLSEGQIEDLRESLDLGGHSESERQTWLDRIERPLTQFCLIELKTLVSRGIDRVDVMGPITGLDATLKCCALDAHRKALEIVFTALEESNNLITGWQGQ